MVWLMRCRLPETSSFTLQRSLSCNEFVIAFRRRSQIASPRQNSPTEALGSFLDKSFCLTNINYNLQTTTSWMNLRCRFLEGDFAATKQDEARRNEPKHTPRELRQVQEPGSPCLPLRSRFAMLRSPSDLLSISYILQRSAGARPHSNRREGAAAGAAAGLDLGRGPRPPT